MFFEEAAAISGTDVVIDLGAVKSLAPIARLSMGWSCLQWLRLKPTAQVYTVDIEQEHINMTKHLVDRVFHTSHHLYKARERHHLVLSDATDFIRNWGSKPIDLLYLDGPGELGSIECLREGTSRGSLGVGSVILFDDCDLPEGRDGRGPCLPVARSLGFETVTYQGRVMDNGRQVLMKRTHVP